MEIPKRFIVAGHEYVVEQSNLVVDNDDNTIFGDHSCCRCKIRLASYITEKGDNVALTPTQIKNTFWHELFHAFNYYWNNEQDENLAQVFANFMCEFEATKQ